MNKDEKIKLLQEELCEREWTYDPGTGHGSTVYCMTCGKMYSAVPKPGEKRTHEEGCKTELALREEDSTPAPIEEVRMSAELAAEGWYIIRGAFPNQPGAHPPPVKWTSPDGRVQPRGTADAYAAMLKMRGSEKKKLYILLEGWRETEDGTARISARVKNSPPLVTEYQKRLLDWATLLTLELGESGGKMSLMGQEEIDLEEIKRKREEVERLEDLRELKRLLEKLGDSVKTLYNMKGTGEW
jgi:hypothetical protein